MVTFLFVKNKLLSLIEGNDMYIVPSSGSNLLGGSMHALINGQPISTFYMLKMEGIYQRDDEVPAKLYAKGVRAGDVKYFDYNEDGDISDADRMNVGRKPFLILRWYYLQLLLQRFRFVIVRTIFGRW